MLEFEKKIVHVLDCEHNTCILSEGCMKKEDDVIAKMLSSKAEKVFHSASRKRGVFRETSYVKELLVKLKDHSITFETFSQKLAQYVFDKKMEHAQYYVSDFIVALLLKDERRYVLVLDNACTQGITHTVQNEEDSIITEIIPYKALISSTLTAKDRAFLIELSDESLCCVENKVEIEGEKVNFYAEVILQSTTMPSYKESVKSITKLTEEMSDKYEMDEVDIVPKMKSMLVDNIENSKPIQIDEIAEELFAEKPLAKAEFKEALKKQGVPTAIEVEYVKPTRSDKVQKIKTDKGIEIIIPVDCMNTKEFVEFKNQPDGTISIQLKNITHITSK